MQDGGWMDGWNVLRRRQPFCSLVISSCEAAADARCDKSLVFSLAGLGRQSGRIEVEGVADLLCLQLARSSTHHSPPSRCIIAVLALGTVSSILKMDPMQWFRLPLATHIWCRSTIHFCFENSPWRIGANAVAQ